MERAAFSWRWRLRGRAHRLACVHGDFHPWNLLFREALDFSVLDRSRGEWGEPADDVSALGVNYLFFGLRKSAATHAHGVAEPFWALFRVSLDTYAGAARLLPGVEAERAVRFGPGASANGRSSPQRLWSMVWLARQIQR